MIRLRKYVNLHIEIDKEEGDICERKDQENDAKEVIMISHLEIFFFFWLFSSYSYIEILLKNISINNVIYVLLS